MTPQPRCPALSGALLLIACAFAFVSVSVAELPGDTSSVWAQDTPQAQRARKRSKRSKRVRKHDRYYAAVSFTPLTLSGCFERSVVCPEDSGATWRGIAGFRGAVGHRWDALALGVRYGAYGYSTPDPALGRTLEGTFGEVLGELRLAPVGARSRWDPYVTLGAGAMIASAYDVEADTAESVYVPGGVVGAGLDYFVGRDYAFGVAYEVFAIANRGDLGDVTALWNARIQATFYWGERKRRKPRRPSRRPPRQPQPQPQPKPTR